MKKTLFVIFFVMVIAGSSSSLFSQVNQAVSYFPLKVGNVWVYNCSAMGGTSSCACILRKYRCKITSSSIFNNKTYFIFQMSWVSVSCVTCYAPYLSDTIRIDTVTGNIYKYASSGGCSNSPFEIMYDSLNAKLNDTVRNNCGISQWRYRCNDTSNQVVFGTSRKTKVFSEPQFESSYSRTFTQGIGLIRAGITFVNCYENRSSLVGCVIDNVLYGDTSMLVGINQISTEIPEKFSLLQNYPNPFNPSTKIRFSIPADSRLRGNDKLELKVFDILGREIASLIPRGQEGLSPGTYEVEFDGTNYSSGLYYYTLVVTDTSASLSTGFTQTKKMVLIK